MTTGFNVWGGWAAWGGGKWSFPKEVIYLLALEGPKILVAAEERQVKKVSQCLRCPKTLETHLIFPQIIFFLLCVYILSWSYLRQKFVFQGVWRWRFFAELKTSPPKRKRFYSLVVHIYTGAWQCSWFWFGSVPVHGSTLYLDKDLFFA